MAKFDKDALLKKAQSEPTRMGCRVLADLGPVIGVLRDRGLRWSEVAEWLKQEGVANNVRTLQTTYYIYRKANSAAKLKRAA